MTIIRCPWPPTEARPNFIKANHWSKYRKPIADYRDACWKLALEQNVHKMIWPDGDIKLSYTFHAPPGCRWDYDAREAAFKSGQDGIADAMKGVDDARFRANISHGKPVNGGCVLVRIITESIQQIPMLGEVN